MLARVCHAFILTSERGWTDLPRDFADHCMLLASWAHCTRSRRADHSCMGGVKLQRNNVKHDRIAQACSREGHSQDEMTTSELGSSEKGCDRPRAVLRQRDVKAPPLRSTTKDESSLIPCFLAAHMLICHQVSLLPFLTPRGSTPSPSVRSFGPLWPLCILVSQGSSCIHRHVP